MKTTSVFAVHARICKICMHCLIIVSLLSYKLQLEGLTAALSLFHLVPPARSSQAILASTATRLSLLITEPAALSQLVAFCKFNVAAGL